MSCRVDTSPLIAGGCVVSLYSGLGIRGDAVPSTGTDGPSILYNDLTLPGDAAAEFYALILTQPSAGAFTPYEDGSFTLVGAPDGVYTFTYRTFKDGADLGVSTVTITEGGGASPIIVPVGRADETDVALGLTFAAVGTIAVPVGMAVETDTALGLAFVSTGPIVLPVGMATETDAALGLSFGSALAKLGSLAGSQYRRGPVRASTRPTSYR